MIRIVPLIVVFLFLAVAFCQSNETLTITTYYPSPAGVYNRLRLFPRNTTPNAPQIGDLYFNQTSQAVMVYKCVNPPSCTSNGWLPVGADVSGDTLVNAQHTGQQCLDAGGTLVPSDVGLPICKIPGGTCPGGWQRYKQYSATTNVRCGQPVGCACSYCGCDSGGHAWGNIAPEVCLYACGYTYCHSCGEWPPSRACPAIVNYVGCY